MGSANEQTSTTGPLNILIVGAGIGGLTAGIALRQAGHNVTLLETSKFSNETGAAINIAPNCNGLLLRLGVNIEDVGANLHEGMGVYTADGQEIFLTTTNRSMWQHKFLLVHRAHLHTALREKAIGVEGKGKPCNLRLSSRVVAVDPHKAEVTLHSGEVLSGDVVLGADGVHSQCRKALEGGLGYVPYDSGHSTFRFLLPMSEILDDPITKPIIKHTGRLVLVISEDNKRMVLYPCVRNTVMNAALIHPSNESHSSDDGWNQAGDKKKMLEIANSFAPQYKAVLAKAPEDALKVWTLVDLPVLPTWVNGRMALLGDAAHPFLPHQAQGGAQAIEDAVSVATVLPLGTRPDEIPDRLDLYLKCRQERANKVQAGTRLSGKPFDEQRKAGAKPMDFQSYNFTHDEYHHSKNMLDRYLRSKQPHYYRQPISFGPLRGPSQPPSDVLGTLTPPQHYGTSYTVRFRTSTTYLKTLFPNESFGFWALGTVAQASFKYSVLENVTRLGGRKLHRCGLYIHGVEYIKKNGEKVHGSFVPVVFEDSFDSVSAEREEHGTPSIRCDIQVMKNDVNDERSIRLGSEGTTFGEIVLGELKPINDSQPQPPQKLSPDDGLLTYRYVPAVGEPGKADAEYAVFSPYQAEPAIHGVAADHDRYPARRAMSAEISFKAHDWNSLPSIHGIARGLAEVPVYEILEATMEPILNCDEFKGARRLE